MTITKSFSRTAAHPDDANNHLSARKIFVIAATNRKTMLDPALFRRSDAVLTYELPGAESVRPLITQRLRMFDFRGLDWDQIATDDTAGLSHADIVRAAGEAARDAVMSERENIELGVLVRALRKRQASMTVQSQ